MLPSAIDIYALPIGPTPAPSPARAEGSNRRPPLPSGRPPPLIARRPVPISKTDPVYGDRRSPPTIRRSPPTMRCSPPAPGLRPQSLPASKTYSPCPFVPPGNLPSSTGLPSSTTSPLPQPAPRTPRGTPPTPRPSPPSPLRRVSPSRGRGRGLPSSPAKQVRSPLPPLEPPPQIDPSINPILRAHLTALSPETRRVLPSILTRLGRTSHAQTCEQFDFTNTTRLDPSIRPAKNPQVTVKVVNMDTLEAALSLPERDPPPLPKDGQPVRFRPLILNFSDVDRPSRNERRGSRHGDFSQSESLCHRTSLGMSLERGRHPVGMNTSVLYSPYVQVVRRDTSDRFLDLDHLENLPVVAAITMRAQYRPETKTYMVPAELGRTRPKQAFIGILTEKGSR
ncbi:hypothetical protein QC764_506450 [Podospora pseudoanserina]|uniref:Uncharacterized protein n=1 Tax=Podospora pseudoanserina TaxID=2609844 RepID=A0ABR0I6Y7_9PEZI|nr:hypothetical protein QC764_506450 [Podospora pseudoanserina]